MSFGNVALPCPGPQNPRVLVNGPEPLLSDSHWWLVPLVLLGLSMLLFMKAVFSNKRLK